MVGVRSAVSNNRFSSESLTSLAEYFLIVFLFCNVFIFILLADVNGNKVT